MKYQYNLQKPSFTVENIDIQNVARPKDFRHSFRNGRTKHGFVYVVSGRMLDLFPTGDKESIFTDAGEMIFIPKGSVYTGVYLEENTEIKIIQFDIAEGELPTYLSRHEKIDLPNAGELVEAFFNPTKNHISNHPF